MAAMKDLLISMTDFFMEAIGEWDVRDSINTTYFLSGKKAGMLTTDDEGDYLVPASEVWIELQKRIMDLSDKSEPDELVWFIDAFHFNDADKVGELIAKHFRTEAERGLFMSQIAQIAQWLLMSEDYAEEQYIVELAKAV